MEVKKKLIDIVRDKIRFKYYSYSNEKTYIHWIKSYIFFHNKKHPVEMKKREIEEFLTSLAVKNKVSPSTQNQAFSAILLPIKLKQRLEIQIENASMLHKKDILSGYGSVYLPFAFDKKSPKAKFEIKWQYLFPMAKVSKDPRNETIRRHHIHPKTLGRNIKVASQKANLNKRVTSHIFRHSYATHLLQAEIDLRSIQ